ncbi:histone deacetylase [Faucicola mancuniensis]|uniref:histone deacetylase family protein n=1 Tax=Faucicola mancuniensis TaxID=1309795 RepID=UPI0028E6AAB5|nr:histone deacetylase [uncultured Moraxella sp.]
MLKIAYSPLFNHAVPEKHRFPMQKYDEIPKRLLAEGTIRPENLFLPKKLSESQILTTHTADYWQHLKDLTLPKKDARAIGFELSHALFERERTIAHATYECALFAKQFGVSLSTSGGTHHGFADHGEGFCVFNDLAITSHLLLNQGLSQQILIIDLDVHQGNGTAHIFANDKRVFTFSMHGAKNFPFRKQQSDLDIELADDTGDDEYLTILDKNLPMLIKTVAPDMLLFLAGVDVLASDKLGKLALTQQGCKQRDSLVFNYAKRYQLPIAVVMGGGYSENLDDVVEAHCNTFRIAKQIFNLD